MTAPPVWPGDHAAVRALWPLRAGVAYVNHGAFGATPRPVLDEQQRWRERLEEQPFDFLMRTLPDAVERARAVVAEFLGADPAGLAFVSNATTGVATVLRSLVIGSGDRVVVTDHVYPAVEIQLRALGVDLAVVPVDLDAADPAASVLAAVDERTRLVVVDAVTSVTALLLPVGAIVAGCRARGVPCLVDAAHVPGLLPVDLRALDPDYWTGNLHKWVCAPKGAAVLYVRAELRDRVRPLVPSTWYEEGYHRAFDWTGSADHSPWLAAPAALELLGELGWKTVRSYGTALAAWGAAHVASVTGATVPAPPERHAQMVLVDAGLPSYDAATACRDELWARHRVEVGATGWRGRGWLRLSAAPYNSAADYERLAEALA
ncbi:MAG TPA: aminotransferase class V-fold PLP-dependent enzyme [Frankiaceae bacterium]|nr:aminotransferase class V-fold PLP-dependent enzyme [Frankiaceae bacterium]